MATTYRYTAEIPPLRTAPDGGILVGKSRVPLETVIGEFNAGATPEEIVQNFSALTLADTYAVISHYLRHKDEVDSYIRQREADGLVIRAQVAERYGSQEIRDKILERARSKGLR